MPVPAYSPPAGRSPRSPAASASTWSSTPTPSGPSSTSTSWTGCFADGAQTLLLTQPHNPWGRVFTRAELEGVRDVVVRHGARVISDEIHAPLVLPGAEHVSYLTSRAPPTTPSRSSRRPRRSTPPGCGAPRSSSGDDRHRAAASADVPMARNDSWSTLGVVAAIAAYTERRPLAGRADRAARRAADAARRAAGRAPARGPDAAARGDVPRLDRPARLRPRAPRRASPRSAARSGSPRATTTSPACPATSGSTSPPPPTRLTEIVTPPRLRAHLRSRLAHSSGRRPTLRASSARGRRGRGCRRRSAWSATR